MRRLPTGTVTLLFTDIEGSTRLLQELGREAYVEALEAHRRLLREAFARRGGVEVEMQGDSFHYAFAAARDAVAAAADAQRALSADECTAQPIRVRIGIHTGEPTISRGLYTGLDVHRAARVMAAGHGGQVLLSQATADLVGADVSEGTFLRDLGEHRLKDLTSPQRLYQLSGEGLENRFPPLRSLENRPTNLPLQPTPLVGRTQELDELSALLSRQEVRLVTLTGPGGTGKTRLALQLAAETIEGYPNGVWFVNLAAVNDPTLVLSTVAQTVGITEQAGSLIADTLAESLREQTALLVLDNFEHVLDAASGIAGLLARAPKLRLLVTSRAPLRLLGEHEYPVAPLPPDEALALFLERAQAAKPHFVLNGNSSLVAEICRRLDNLPLAIELAAARIKLLSEQALLDRLDKRLELLAGGARDLPVRQQTLRAAIDWSHSLLTAADQQLFARLAVFTEGATLDAIEAICNDGDELDVFEGVASLVDNSLLRGEEGLDAQPRFRMLETIQEYAHERLEHSGLVEETRRRHAEYFRVLAKEALPSALRIGWNRRDGDAGLEKLKSERGNLRLALDFFAELGAPEEELEMARSLIRFWGSTNGFREGREALEHALARAGDADPGLRARALIGVATFAWHQGDHLRAGEASREGLALARSLGDREATAAALANLAISTHAGELEPAVVLLEEALHIDEETGRGDAELPRTLTNLGYARLLAGDLDGAATDLERAVKEMPIDPDCLVVALVNLAFVRSAQGREEEARELFGETLALGLGTDEKQSSGYAVLGLAALAVTGSDPEPAVRLIGAVDALADDVGFGYEPFERGVRERAAAHARSVLGEQKVNRLLREGRGLQFEDACALALRAFD